ncbi:MAG: hypothetical protein HW408_828 [Actinobacteria bacterium]|nr:hypothetical protein [Actinomycetota bacterium]
MKKSANVTEWVVKAEQDFEGACILARKRKKPVNDLVCFHCQQSAEKYLKACLTLHEIPFAKTHDLIKFKNLLSGKIPEIELIADLLIFLNEFSVQYRYPGEKASAAYARRALKAARDVRKFFASRLPGISR